VARFEYVAKDVSGAQTSSALHAESAEAVADLLHRDGFVVLSIREVKEDGWSLRGRGGLFGRKVRSSAVGLFTRQLSSMLRAGLPLIRALYGLAREEKNPVFREALISVAADIEGGQSLSGAMARHPDVFSKLYVSMIRSGEESGALDVIMDHLVRYMDRTESVKRKVKSALTYPIFVVGFAMIAFIVLLVKVVPMMAQIYEKLGADLPGPTQIVISVSRFVSSNIWMLFALLAMAVAFHRVSKRVERIQLFVDRMKFRIPILGRLLKQVVVAKFLRTLGILVVSGLPILDALELSGGTSGNRVIKKAADDIGAMVSKGSNLATGFHATGVFPETVVQMVSTGEETGKLGDMLGSVSDHYDEQVEVAIEGIASIIEPLMIVLVGGLIALMLVAMFLPVFHLGGAVRQGLTGGR